ncbi:TonB-dependent receptor [Comamonas sp. 17RB]|uniref:TonB-dependent receptor n=1 Tax=Comamonas sp. 17RB TaxID=3047025 RepID=UPI0024B82583|nr:TonB-dependent receptor [Comamonas sp. 17RB]MDI9857115.1 TonB-dependent receptor [Comamonas sp. 17RB]
MPDRSFAPHPPATLRLLAAAALVAMASAPVHAQPAPVSTAAQAPIAFQIPAQALDSALAQLARTAQLQLMAPPALLQGRKTAGVQGTLSPQAAAQQLLQGSGLNARISGNTLLITAATGETALQDVTVRSRADGLPEAYAGGQIARGGSLGVLGTNDVMDTPFSVVNFTSELLENQQARTLADVVVNDASVRSLTASGGFGDSFQIRGFNVANGETFVNNFGGLAATTTIPLEMVERVELLKGPGALARGLGPDGSIGGSINLVTKRAGDAPLTRLTTTYTSQAQLSTHLDVGRRFGEDKAWGIRVNGVLRGGEGNIDGGRQKMGMGSLGLDYRSSRLRWSLDALALHDDTREFRPQAMVLFGPGGYSDTRLPAPPDGRLNFYPGTSIDSTNKMVTSRLEYDLTDRLTLMAGVGYNHFRVNQNFPSGNLLDSSGRMLVGNSIYDDARETTTADLGVKTSFRTGAVDHRVALVANWLDRDSGYYYDGTLPSTSSTIYDPLPIVDGSHGKPVKDSNLRQQGLALTDSLAMLDDRLLLTFGLRHQRIKTHSPYSQTQTSANSPLAGIVIKPVDHLALYANYTAGLTDGGTAPVGVSNAFQTMSPFKSKQLEAGVKVDWGNMVTQAAVFQIKKPSGYTDPVSNVYSYAGEQRNRGLELSTYGELQRGLRLMASAAFTQAKLTRIEDLSVQGNNAPNVARRTLSVAADWDVPGVQGLSLNGRALYVSSVHLDNANTLRVPGWTRLDFGARYAMQVAGKPVVLRANIENLANRRYWLTTTVSSSYSYAMVSAPRTFTLSAAIDF